MKKTAESLNLSVENMVYRTLRAAQTELGLPDLSSTINRILTDWWLGKSSPKGHNSFPCVVS
jgi:hypothetical protein